MVTDGKGKCSLTLQQTCHQLFYEILIEEQLLHVCKVEPSPQTTQPLFSKSWTEGAWNAVNNAEYFYTLYPRHWFDLGLLNYDQMHKSNFGVNTNIIIIKTWLFIDFGNSTNDVIKHNLQFKIGLNNHKPRFKKGMSLAFKEGKSLLSWKGVSLIYDKKENPWNGNQRRRFILIMLFSKIVVRFCPSAD